MWHGALLADLYPLRASGAADPFVPKCMSNTLAPVEEPSLHARPIHVKACRSVAQALEHEGIRDATGTEVSVSAQERAMPEPQPHQATCRAVFIVSYYNQILLVYSSRARARLFGHCVHICSKRSF